MNINEMHIAFRTLGQQMGLQLVRAILPESIDEYLNDSIIEWARKRVQANVDSIYNDKITIQHNSISPINGLRSLYKQFFSVIGEDDKGNIISNLSLIENVMFYTSFEVNYVEDKNCYGCRIIDRDKLSITLSDYCNGASREYPIVSMYSNGSDEDIIEIHIGKDKAEFDSLIVNYISMPDKVKYAGDGKSDVNCNLPEYCHYEIVEMAVNKYFYSVGSTNQTVSAQ